MKRETNDVMNEIVKQVAQMTDECSDAAGKSARLSMDLTMLIAQIGNMESDLHDCVNELCLKCGSYRMAHEGACDECRWLKVKEDLR